MTVMKTRQGKHRSSKKKNKRVGSRYWKILAASALLVGALLIPKKCEKQRVSQPSKAHISMIDSNQKEKKRVERVTFEAAKHSPLFRQAYVDRMAQGSWKNDCIEEYIYDPTGIKIQKYIRKKIGRFLSKGSDEQMRKSIEKNLRTDHEARYNVMATVPWTIFEYGNGKKLPMFIGPLAFRWNEDDLLRIIKDHEAVHAIDACKGMDLAGRTITYKDLKIKDRNILVHVSEVRAFLNQVKSRGNDVLSLATENKIVRNEVRQFTRNFDYVIFWEIVKTFGSINEKTGVMKVGKGMLRSRSTLLNEVKERFDTMTKKEDVGLFMARSILVEHGQFYLQLKSSYPVAWEKLGLNLSILQSARKLKREN